MRNLLYMALYMAGVWLSQHQRTAWEKRSSAIQLTTSWIDDSVGHLSGLYLEEPGNFELKC